jgi:hypothetical protein
METTSNNTLLDLAFELFNRVKSDEFEYVYRGDFSHDITKKILSLAETNVQKTIDKSGIQKRIYHIMVEGLQNIAKHQDEIRDELIELENSGIFAIQKKGSEYYVTTCNLITKDNIEPLSQKLDTINSLEKDALNQYHKEMLRSGGISDKGGAGLGLIEMARKSGKKLIYDFKTINESYSYFYLQTEIAVQISESEEVIVEKPVSVENHTLGDIKKLHELLNKENLLLNFNGYFDQTNVLSLLSVIKGQMDASTTSKKVYNIMVEMLQNICKHGDNKTVSTEGNQGIFFLSQKDNSFNLTSGNYIKNPNIRSFNSRIEFVNSLSSNELSEYYNKVLLSLGTSDAKKTGLGLVDMRIKSDKILNFSFKRLDDYFSFYTLQTSIVIKTRSLENLIIEGSEDTSEIIFQPDKNVFKVSGVSLPEDAVQFYSRIFDWLKKFELNPNPTMSFNFSLDYLNTASSKQLFELIVLLERIAQKCHVTVRWHYDKVDEDMLSIGKRYKNLVNLDFEFVEL